MPLDSWRLARHGGRAIAAVAVLVVLVLLVSSLPATAQAVVRAPVRYSPPTVLPLAPPPVTAALAITGTVVADTGFRPKVDGFSFRNYEGGSNLTAAALRRLFGPNVCAGGQDAPCLLTPAAEQWMGHYNRLMAAGGHCYGFSTLSQLFYAGHAHSSGFGAPVTPRLQLEGNQPLQQEIAYAWTFQALPAVRRAGISGSPAAVLAALIKGLNGPAAGDSGSGPRADSYTLAFTKADGSGGHAVTPYAVEDRGGGQFAVLVYDSNFPGQGRPLLIDREANTWSYNAAANPNRRSGRYSGDAASQSLFLFPTGPALGTQPCPFCAPQDAPGDTPAGATGDDSGGASSAGAAGPSFNQVFLGGDAPPGARLVFAATTAGGDRSATLPLRAELPGVKQYPIFTDDLWADSAPPDVYLPAGRAYALAIDAGALTQPAQGDIVLIGRGFTLAARNIQVDPDAGPSVFYPAADGSSLAFAAAGEETPIFDLGMTAGGASYALTIAGASLPSGASADLALDGDGALQITFSGTDAPLQYDLALRRIDAEGEALFAHADLTYLPDSVVYVDYGAWEGEGDVDLQVDEDGDGTIDDTESLPDEPALDPGADSEGSPEIDPAACEPGSPCDDTGADLPPDAIPPGTDLDAGEPGTAGPDVTGENGPAVTPDITLDITPDDADPGATDQEADPDGDPSGTGDGGE